VKWGVSDTTRDLEKGMLLCFVLEHWQDVVLLEHGFDWLQGSM
jgi:hypothetical protein